MGTDAAGLVAGGPTVEDLIGVRTTSGPALTAPSPPATAAAQLPARWAKTSPRR